MRISHTMPILCASSDHAIAVSHAWIVPRKGECASKKRQSTENSLLSVQFVCVCVLVFLSPNLVTCNQVQTTHAFLAKYCDIDAMCLFNGILLTVECRANIRGVLLTWDARAIRLCAALQSATYKYYDEMPCTIRSFSDTESPTLRHPTVTGQPINKRCT